MTFITKKFNNFMKATKLETMISTFQLIFFTNYIYFVFLDSIYIKSNTLIIEGKSFYLI